MMKAKEDAATALYNCVTPESKAYYDAKLKKEKEQWGYDKMSAELKKTFDENVKVWVDWHQKNDANVKKSLNY